MLKQKSDALAAFKRFEAIAKNGKEMKIKCLRTDRGGKFR